jgi:hypothetical protein
MATAMRPPASTEPLSEPSSVMAMSDAITTRMACTLKSAAVAMPASEAAARPSMPSTDAYAAQTTM